MDPPAAPAPGSPAPRSRCSHPHWVRGLETSRSPRSQRRAPQQGQGVKQGHSRRIVRPGSSRSLWEQPLIPFHPPSWPSAVFQAFRRRVTETRAIVSAAPQPPPASHPSVCPSPLAPRWARIRQQVRTQLPPQHRPQPELRDLHREENAGPTQVLLLFTFPQALSLTLWSKPKRGGRGGGGGEALSTPP